MSNKTENLVNALEQYEVSIQNNYKDKNLNKIQKKTILLWKTHPSSIAGLSVDAGVLSSTLSTD